MGDAGPVDVDAHRAAGHLREPPVPRRDHVRYHGVVPFARPPRPFELFGGRRRGKRPLDPKERRRATDVVALDRLKGVRALRAVDVDAAAHAVIEEPHGAGRLPAARVTSHADTAREVQPPGERAVPVV
jgi:hypothetical protein